jgi:hypothetical protein
MLIESRDRALDRALQSRCGWLYGRHPATLSPEQLRKAQSAVDGALNALSTPTLRARQEHNEIKSAVNKALSQRS